MSPLSSFEFDLHVLQWVTEHGEGAINRVGLDLVAAQYQRRALGCEGQVVCGAASVEGVVRVYASWWEKVDNEDTVCDTVRFP